MKTDSRRSGFTLIELLVVISIIALLAGLAFPAFDVAITGAQKTQASAMCNQLSIAVNFYNTEYGVNPLPSGQSADYSLADNDGEWSTMCIALNGNRNLAGAIVPGNSIANSRYIQFMSYNKKDLKDPTSTSQIVVYNPVKRSTDRYYRMVVDGDYDGVISIEDLSAQSGMTTLNLGVGVWAYGDRSTDNTKKVGSYK